MSEETRSLLTVTVLVDVMMVVAVVLTLARGRGRPQPSARRAVLLAALPALGWQVLHFLEELRGGLHERLPELLDLAPVSAELFTRLNLAWLVIWGLSLLGLRAGMHIALFPIWFLAIASAVNGVIHPLLALVVGGYFPGLWTSPVSGLVGWLLLRRLRWFTDG